MGRSRDDKARSHERIVAIAARQIREAGVDGPGVAEVMKTAGLTHGGFYKHFGSRDELIAEAADRSFAEGRRAIDEAIDGADDPLAAFVQMYLSDSHRDEPGAGCAVVALGADAARAEGPVRHAYTDQVNAYIARLRELQTSTGTDAGDRERATVAVSTLVGALLLARAVDDPALSEEILRSARDALLSPLGADA